MDKIEEFEQKVESSRNVWISKHEVFRKEFLEYQKLRETGVLKDNTKELFEFRDKLDRLLEDVDNAKKEYKHLHGQLMLWVRENSELSELFRSAFEGLL